MQAPPDGRGRDAPWWRSRWFRGVLALVLLLAMAAYWTRYAGG